MSMGIFNAVHDAFAAQETLSTQELYRQVQNRTGIPAESFSKRVPIGKASKQHSPMERTARWTVQTLKSKGLVRQLDGRRGVWTLTEEGKHRFHRVRRGEVLVAFSTHFGVALWADCRDALRGLGEPIVAAITSPPYPLAKPRAYGNVDQHAYPDWLTSAMEPIVRHLAPGGCIALNLSNDIFISNSPARSLVVERVLISLCEKLGLHRMDTLIWNSVCKAPGPVQWASNHRFQLHVGYEPILWLTNDPHRCRSNNQRVLQPHSPRHLALIARGGEQQDARYSDGAYGRRKGSFGRETAGKIARNVLDISHTCSSQRAYKAKARAMGLPAHGAPMPLALARFLVEFLTEKGDLVFDPFGGSLSTCVAAEELGRRWIGAERNAEYLLGASSRFNNPEVARYLEQLLGHERGAQSSLWPAKAETPTKNK